MNQRNLKLEGKINRNYINKENESKLGVREES